MTRILIVGAGAVGGYFGGRLAQAGRDVTFLVRAGRAEALRRDGLRILSPHGDLTLTPAVAEAGGLSAPYDLILFSVKGYQLDQAIDDVAGAVGPETVILPVLNGMAHMGRLTERLGSQAVIGGVCIVATQLDPNGCIVQMSDFQKLSYGERDGADTPRIRCVDGLFSRAGFDAELSMRIEAEMWKKWMTLASLGAVCCLLGGSFGEAIAADHGSETMAAILDECDAAARALGHPPSPAFFKRLRALTAPGSTFTSSMYRDMVRGAPVEADTILGDLVARARTAGVAMPLTQAAYVRLQVYAHAR